MATKQQIHNRLAWIKDLKTTTEPQGTGMFHNKMGYCCLGRAAVVMGKTLVDISVRSPREGELPQCDLRIYPQTFADWFGVRIHTADRLMERWIHLNDNSRKSFKEIAEDVLQEFTDLDGMEATE